MLLLPSYMLAYALKASWEGDIGSIQDGVKWSDALDTLKMLSPKLSDRLTQIYIPIDHT